MKIKTIASVIAILLFCELILSQVLLRLPQPIGTEESKWHLAMEKIRKCEGSPDIVFLGDSTMLVDDKRFSERTGLKALNLRLSGSHITCGDIGMLYKLVQANKTPRALVVWHTVDVWQRGETKSLIAVQRPTFEEILNYYKVQKKIFFDRFSQLGAEKSWLYFYRTFRLTIQWPVKEFGQLFRFFAFHIPSYVEREKIHSAIHFQYKGIFKKNYKREIVDRKILPNQVSYVALDDPTPSAESVAWFLEMNEFAQRHNIKVYFARSTLRKEFRENPRALEKVVQLNKELDRLADRIPNMTVLNRDNIWLDSDMTNDDKDHVNEKGQVYITDYIIELLKPYLETTKK